MDGAIAGGAAEAYTPASVSARARAASPQLGWEGSMRMFPPIRAQPNRPEGLNVGGPAREHLMTQVAITNDRAVSRPPTSPGSD